MAVFLAVHELPAHQAALEVQPVHGLFGKYMNATCCDLHLFLGAVDQLNLKSIAGVALSASCALKRGKKKKQLDVISIDFPELSIKKNPSVSISFHLVLSNLF